MTPDDILSRAAAGQRLSAAEALTLAECADQRPLMRVEAKLNEE